MAAEQIRQKLLVRESSRSSVYSTPWLVAISVAIFWTALILIVHRNSPRTLISFHGLLHAAIAGEFLQGGVTLSPENPFYAGQTLPYYWPFHFLAAQLTRFFGLNIFHSFELLILLWTAGMMITAVFLGRKLYRSTAAGVLMGYLIMAGANSFGWLFFLRSFLRRGPEVFSDNPNYLWGIVHPLYGSIRYNDVGGLYGPLVNFFFNITSRPMALASLLMMVFGLQSVIRRPQLFSVVLLTLSSTMTTALSPVIGITCVSALILSCTICWLWQVRQSKLGTITKPFTRGFLYSSLAMFMGLILATPTFYHLILGPSANRTTFWLFSIEGLRQLLTVLFTASVLLFLAVLGMLRSTNDDRVFLAIPFIGGLVMLVLNLCFVLPAGNSSNFFHAGVVMLAVPAAGSIVRNSAANTVGIRKWVLAGIFLVSLPTLCLVVMSYTSRPALSVSFQSQVIERSPKDSDLAVMYDWIRAKTDAQAVFVIDPRDPFAVCGNTAELPAMTQRAIFTENRKHYISAPYPDSKLRFDIAVRSISGEELNKDDITYLSALKRPVFLVSYDSSSNGWADRMQTRYGEPRFARGNLAIYQVALPSQ